jgi:glycosyltransferase involved in cell wall biosynthesis
VPYTDLGIPEGRRDPRLVPRLIRVVRRFRPGILHTHTLPANFVGRAARPLCGVPVMITSAHNVYEGGRAKMAYYRLTDRFADLTTNVSPIAVDRFVEVGAVPSRDRIRYMPNGMDLQRFAPDPAVRARVRAELGVDGDTFLWLAVGRHSEQKDYPNLLAALGRLGADRRWLVAIAGTGPLLDLTRQEVEDRKLTDRVQILGLRTDVGDLMKAADGFALSSAYEGLPIVLLEAGASALPMVATDVGGNGQIVEDRVGGFLVPPRDPGALAGALERVMALAPEERASMGAAARERVGRGFGMDAVADQWDALYRELLGAT